MKKCVAFLISCMFLLIPTINAETITDGDYTIEIDKVYFSIYDDDNFSYEDNNGDYKLYGTALYTQEITDYTINPSYEQSIDKKNNGIHRKVNLGLAISEDLETIFRTKVSDVTKDYYLALKVDYRITSMPNNFKSIFYESSSELLNNSSFAPKFIEMDNNEALEQTLSMIVYNGTEKTYVTYDEGEEIEEYPNFDLFFAFLNLFLFSENTNTIYEGEFLNDTYYYLHNVTDFNEVIGTDFCETFNSVKPSLTFKDITTDSVMIGSTADNVEENDMCNIYKSENENGPFKYLFSINCNNNIFLGDYDLKENTNYYYLATYNCSNTKGDVVRITTKALDNQDNLPATNETNNEEIIENPNTGIINIGLLSGVLISTATIGLIVINKKKKTY